MEKAIFKVTNKRFFVSIRKCDKTRFGGTFRTREAAEKAAKRLTTTLKIKKPKKLVN
jgi:hypothetical protein